MLAKGDVDAKKIPPGEESARLHLFRSYLQITEWKNLESDLDPLLWGWQKNDTGLLEPIATDKNKVAPSSLLKVITCSCKTGCSKNTCSCKKHSLPCVIACKNCRGVCENMEKVRLHYNCRL